MKESYETSMYLCYFYLDYHKDFHIKMHHIFAEEEDAINFARDLSYEKNDPGVQYINHEGKWYDSLAADGVGRIAVDNIITYLHHDIEEYEPGTIINSVIFHAAFDNEVEALEFAEELGDGKESEGEYACQSGMLFDQHEKDQESLWRIAMDYVTVG
ncbi:hypothetical protein C1646_660785 [Rhizophagus diaphanus]|nr:hypothetical protein C1646_660785 [Rhizophagus diaphanus] [Rhizophagus sp. MUCL 43196]